jgi:peptidyl-prolyl cis-trans isomerase SurA
MVRFVNWWPCLIFCLLLTGKLHAQNQDVLLRIGDVEVSREEFKFQYRKAAEISKRSGIPLESLDDYLERYINFKIKVVDALKEGRDTLATFQKEFQQYKRELAGPFMQDRQTLDSLVEQAWERNREEVEASHILFGFSNTPPSPRDTLEAYNQAMMVRDLLLQGHPFDSLAKIYSTEPAANQSAGYLGFFSALQMVYPFESAAYSLQPGEISNPVRTRFGYHLIKLHSRQKARGEVRIAHLLIRSVEGMPLEDKNARKSKANSLFERLKENPEEWNQLVLEHSDDIPTRERGGELGWLGPGRLIRQMDSTAFALMNPGDLSAPFLSPFGWHIMKLLDKADPPSNFEEVQPELLEQVKRDSRSTIAVERFKNQAIDRLGWKANKEGMDRLLSLADESILVGQWMAREEDLEAFKVFEARDTTITALAVASYISENQSSVDSSVPEEKMKVLVDNFSDQTMMDLYRERLEQVEPEYRYLIMEYRDGMLLFETMEEKVWGKSTNDTLGLRAFFEEKKENYRQIERVKTQFLIARDAESRSYLLQLFEASEDINAFRKRYEEEKEGLGFNIDEQSGQFNARVHPWLSEFEKLEPLNALDLDDAYVVALVDEEIPSYIPSLSAIKGQVINDYQTYLEEQWLAGLKSRYPVYINKEVFDELQEELALDL